MAEAADHDPVIPRVWKSLNVGYSTLGNDLTRPGDRRRFCHYASRRDVPFEIANPSSRYDLVVTTSGGDLGIWSRLPESTKLVFDLVDSHLAVPRTDLRSALRGAFKFAFRHTRHLHLDYRALIAATCRRADAVVCTTEEQKGDIRGLCPNVHVILDFQPEAAKQVKTDYGAGNVFNLVWEGLPGNLVTFSCIADALRRLRTRRKIALHLITDLERAIGSTHVWMRPTKPWARRLIGIDEIYLYEWNQHVLPTISTACDLAVIPIPLDKPFFAGKPENKLMLFWRMGLPVVTSATPAYERAMRGAGLAMTCRTTDDWVRTLERYIDDEQARREAGQRGMAYAHAAHGEPRLLQKWDDVFASVL